MIAPDGFVFGAKNPVGLTVPVGTCIWFKNSPHNDMTVPDSEYKWILSFSARFLTGMIVPDRTCIWFKNSSTQIA